MDLVYHFIVGLIFSVYLRTHCSWGLTLVLVFWLAGLKELWDLMTYSPQITDQVSDLIFTLAGSFALFSLEPKSPKKVRKY